MLRMMGVEAVPTTCAKGNEAAQEIRLSLRWAAFFTSVYFPFGLIRTLDFHCIWGAEPMQTYRATGKMFPTSWTHRPGRFSDPLGSIDQCTFRRSRGDLRRLSTFAAAFIVLSSYRTVTMYAAYRNLSWSRLD